MPVEKGEGGPDRSRKARIYVVKPGDSLSKIAKAVYGDADRWTEIFEANKDEVKDPNRIEAGQELRIP
jgi:nucleoid-associated protein YgaU